MRLSTPRPLFVLAVLVLFSQSAASAATLTLDFEGFSDSTPLTTQIPSLTFVNATVIAAGVSLNEFEFPPHSGANVLFDDGGPIAITFASQITDFRGYFTYSQPLTLAALDVTSAQVASAQSAFSNNEALSGDSGSSPNELLALSFAGGISGITIAGDTAGGSFVVDDLTVNASVPEPVPFLLLLSPIATLIAWRIFYSMKHSTRVMLAAILTPTLLASVVLVVWFRSPHPGKDFADELVVHTRRSVTDSQFQAIANAVHASNVRPAAHVADESAWTVDILWAKNSADTSRAAKLFDSYPGIDHVDIIFTGGSINRLE